MSRILSSFTVYQKKVRMFSRVNVLWLTAWPIRRLWFAVLVCCGLAHAGPVTLTANGTNVTIADGFVSMVVQKTDGKVTAVFRRLRAGTSSLSCPCISLNRDE